MANENYEYHALGAYKECLFNLLMKDEKSELLMDILMPVIEDERFDKIDNFLGGNFEYYENGSLQLVDLKKHLFDVPFVYNTITDTRNVICIDTELLSCSQSIKEMKVTINIMCHKESIELDVGTRLKYRKEGYIGRNRLDIAVAIIGDIVNRSSKFGIGKLSPSEYNPVKSYYFSNEYFGKILTYTCTDFMKNYKVITDEK